jgi:hypothetical protein
MTVLLYFQGSKSSFCLNKSPTIEKQKAFFLFYCKFLPKYSILLYTYISVADPNPNPACHLDADPYPGSTLDFDADPDPDPDPTFEFDVDPDTEPTFQIEDQNLGKVLK